MARYGLIIAAGAALGVLLLAVGGYVVLLYGPDLPPSAFELAF